MNAFTEPIVPTTQSTMTSNFDLIVDNVTRVRSNDSIESKVNIESTGSRLSSAVQADRSESLSSRPTSTTMMTMMYSRDLTGALFSRCLASSCVADCEKASGHASIQSGTCLSPNRQCFCCILRSSSCVRVDRQCRQVGLKAICEPNGRCDGQCVCSPYACARHCAALSRTNRSDSFDTRRFDRVESPSQASRWQTSSIDSIGRCTATGKCRCDISISSLNSSFTEKRNQSTSSALTSSNLELESIDDPSNVSESRKFKNQKRPYYHACYLLFFTFEFKLDSFCKQ